MNTHIRIHNRTLALALSPVERDPEIGCAWRNGVVTLSDGHAVDCGGGWIESQESADQKNEELGIAGGVRQGVSYPNTVRVGDYTPYRLGEDESDWVDHIMPHLLGGRWGTYPELDDEIRSAHAEIQKGLKAIHEAEGCV